MSPLIAREIVYRAVSLTDVYAGELNMSQKLDIATEGYKLFKEIEEGNFCPNYIIFSQVK